jgi:hypothetical protein
VLCYNYDQFKNFLYEHGIRNPNGAPYRYILSVDTLRGLSLNKDSIIRYGTWQHRKDLEDLELAIKLATRC